MEAHCIILNGISSTLGVLKSVVQKELRKSRHYHCYNQGIEIQRQNYMNLEEL